MSRRLQGLRNRGGRCGDLRWRPAARPLPRHFLSRGFPTRKLACGVTAGLRGWAGVLSLAIMLAGNRHAAYFKAKPKVKCRFNHVVLEGIYIEGGKVARAEFREVLEALLTPEFE